MAKKGREQNKWTIPSDWDEETDGFQLAVICVPNSRQWRGIFVGQISDLAYGRNYNKLTGTITDAQAIARDIFESMTMACLDDVINALQCACEGMTVLAEKSSEIEQEIDPPPSNGDISVGPGEQFPDEAAYFSAKCSVANGIYDTVLETVQWLDDNNVDLLAGTFGGVTTGLVTALLGAGPVGWAIVLISSATAALASFLIRYAVNFFDLKEALVDVHSECVLALYNASDTSAARTEFIAAAEGATQPITPIESDLLGLLLSGKMLNQLFGPRPDVGSYESPNPINCPTSWLHTFDFTVSNGGWTNDATHSRPFGTYSPGVGWVSVWGAVGVFDERLYLEKTGVGGEIIQSVTVTYVFSGACGPARRTGIVVWDGSTIQREDSVTPDCGDFVHEGIFSDVGTIITTNAVGDASADGALEITITEIVVTGSGTDPF